MRSLNQRANMSGRDQMRTDEYIEMALSGEDGIEH